MRDLNTIFKNTSKVEMFRKTHKFYVFFLTLFSGLCRFIHDKNGNITGKKNKTWKDF